jgi:hypothetical protein
VVVYDDVSTVFGFSKIGSYYITLYLCFIHLNTFKHMMYAGNAINGFRRADNYKVSSSAQKPWIEVVQAGPLFQHYLCISWKCTNSVYVAMSFLIDTGASEDFLLSDNALQVLMDNGVCFYRDSECTNKLDILTLSRTFAVKVSVGNEDSVMQVARCRKRHSSSNNVDAIGLKMIKKLGIDMRDCKFVFGQDISNV